MLGYYENFPKNIHHIETFTFSISSRKIQLKLAETLKEINYKTYSFEEIGNPTIPDCSVNFEFGVAESGNFTFLNQEEAAKLQDAIAKCTLHIIDWFCAVRYHRNSEPKRQPLKFDYYMLRFTFEKNSIQTNVFHERGPRYVTPEDLVLFISGKMNETQKRTLLKRETV
jgi:hypothetical protein